MSLGFTLNNFCHFLQNRQFDSRQLCMVGLTCLFPDSACPPDSVCFPCPSVLLFDAFYAFPSCTMEKSEREGRVGIPPPFPFHPLTHIVCPAATLHTHGHLFFPPLFFRVRARHFCRWMPVDITTPFTGIPSHLPSPGFAAAGT